MCGEAPGEQGWKGPGAAPQGARPLLRAALRSVRIPGSCGLDPSSAPSRFSSQLETATARTLGCAWGRGGQTIWLGGRRLGLPNLCAPFLPKPGSAPKTAIPVSGLTGGEGKVREGKRGPAGAFPATRLKLLPPPVLARRQPTLAFTNLGPRRKPWVAGKFPKACSALLPGGQGRVERTPWAPGLAHIHSRCITAGASAPVWEDANWPRCWGFSLLASRPGPSWI